MSPSECDRFYLRIFLNHVRGSISFEELKTLNGNTCRTFKESAQMRGHHDDYLRRCLQEACSTRMSSSLRRLFVSILMFCQPTGVRELWEEFHPYMSEDYGRSSSASIFFITNKLLLDIRRLLHHYKHKLDDFDLPSISIEFLADFALPRIIEDEIPDEDLRSIEHLNNQQRMTFDIIVESIMNNQTNFFFIDGPGGLVKLFFTAQFWHN